MSKDELIAKQQLRIEELEQMLQENKQVVKSIKLKFYAMGQPLNDNLLKFNKEKQKWCFEVYDLVTGLHSI